MQYMLQTTPFYGLALGKVTPHHPQIGFSHWTIKGDGQMTVWEALDDGIEMATS
jgi:hypothetical protein